MKKIKMARETTLTFEEGCNKYLENCRQRNLREGTINHYRQSFIYFYKFFKPDMPMRKAKNKGAHIGLPKGTSLTTKKSIECKAIIQKHSKDFGGSLEDPDVIKLCGCSRNSYYKYKREIKHIYIWTDSIA